MANQKIFCSVPWHNTHLYWDGSYGACCSETRKPIGENKNIKFVSLQEWYTSDTMKNFRNRILGNKPLPECQSCYYEESFGYQSRRIRENFKVGIFTEQAFTKSFAQSTWHQNFISDIDKMPIDWHIDFGNECNLACKMCSPVASSKIASHYDTWNIAFNKSNNWTNDTDSWNQFLRNVLDTKNLHRIHVMGGEPCINKKFIEFIDWLVDKKLTDLEISFVTNATVLNYKLIQNLQKFKNVDIEISVESTEKNNEYIRQGSKLEQIWENVKKYCELQSSTLSIVLRSVPQLLSVNTYHLYIQKAATLGLSVQSIPLREPSYLGIQVLPYDIRQKLKNNFINLKNNLILNNKHEIKTICIGRDPSRLAQQFISECDSIINILDLPEPTDVDQLRLELINWLKKWDKIYGHDARQIYPEYSIFLQKYGYSV